MLSQILSQTFIPWLTCLGLLIFLAVFIGVILWVNRRGSEAIYAELSLAPFSVGTDSDFNQGVES